jgi:hypothetical protein
MRRIRERCTCHEDVETLMAADDLIDERADGRLVRDVHCVRLGENAGFDRHPGSTVAIDIGNDDRRPLPREPQHARAADAGSPDGDDRELPRDPGGRIPSRRQASG